MERKTKRRTRRRTNKFFVFILILLQIALSGALSIAMVYYGPFPILRRLIVGTAMSSYTHQYLATAFLSKERINEILGKNQFPQGNDQASSKEETQGLDQIKIQNTVGKKTELYEIDGDKYKGYMLIVPSPKNIHVAMTRYLGERGERTSDMAAAQKALAAINGGGFADISQNKTLWTGTGSYPIGFVIQKGKVAYQGVDQNDKQDVIAFDKEGRMIIGKHSLKKLLKMQIEEAVTFGPPLVINGKRAFRDDGGQGITARTAIGQREDGAVLLLVLDGRRINMPGATLKDVQKVMMDYGAINASNLDGGSSTTMVYGGNVINNPCNPLGERSIATCFLVK